MCNCGDNHPQGANYYVSVFDPVDNAGHGRVGLLLGPFPDHAEALALVETGKRIAHQVNDRAFWYAYGTLAMSAAYTKPGVLNELWEKEKAHDRK